ncbi:MAG: hypothetical protein ACPGLV_11210 [Bacteroidia bacterium]
MYKQLLFVLFFLALSLQITSCKEEHIFTKDLEHKYFIWGTISNGAPLGLFIDEFISLYKETSYTQGRVIGGNYNAIPLYDSAFIKLTEIGGMTIIDTYRVDQYVYCEQIIGQAGKNYLMEVIIHNDTFKQGLSIPDEFIVEKNPIYQGSKLIDVEFTIDISKDTIHQDYWLAKYPFSSYYSSLNDYHNKTLSLAQLLTQSNPEIYSDTTTLFSQIKYEFENNNHFFIITEELDTRWYKFYIDAQKTELNPFDVPNNPNYYELEILNSTFFGRVWAYTQI